MSDTCTTHQSRVPRRSSGKIKGGMTTVEDERGPGLDFYFVFCVRQSSVKGCHFSFVFVHFIIKVSKCSPVPASFFPIYELCYINILGSVFNFILTVAFIHTYINTSYAYTHAHTLTHTPLHTHTHTHTHSNANYNNQSTKLCFFNFLFTN